ncbi:GH25 family lysozyme [Dactylosporangium sp. CA-092794]|uniref:GH25 family lysozyme n=1 Tax=Dactylosporangium sp. CA-092794 TaxID=3239929 RepID=UPI003D8F7C59
MCAVAAIGTASAQSPDDTGGHAQAGSRSSGLRASAVAPGVPGAPAGYSVLGVDVSSHDHSQFPIDWPGVAASGVKFAYVKASEGQFYTNPYFHDDNVAAKAAGLLTGAYAFGRPDLRDPVGEANFFIDHAEWRNDAQTLVPFLDLEWPYSSLKLPDCYGLTPAEMVAWIHAYADRVRARTGRAMMIYTNLNWWNPCTGNDTSFASNPLDIANWSGNPPTTNLPSGWSTFAIWQYAGGNNSLAGNYDKNAFNGDYAALTRLAGGSPATDEPFELRAYANDHYVSADNAGKAPLIPNRTSIGVWETYDLVDAGNGDVALRSHANGLYVTAENAGNAPLVANRTAVGAWEKFTLAENDDGSISLYANINHRYVTAESGGNKPLIANRTAVGPWEKFAKVPVPAVVSLRANTNGRYVTADNGGKSPLAANRTAVGAWEQYDLVDLGDGNVALRSHANGLYVTAENAGKSSLVANRPAAGAWERFSIVKNDDGSISLRANVNGLYVTAENGGALPLIANRTTIGDWEKFTRIG